MELITRQIAIFAKDILVKMIKEIATAPTITVAPFSIGVNQI